MNGKTNNLKKMIKEGIRSFKSGTNTMFKEFFNKNTNKQQRANMWSFSRLIIPIITAVTSVIAIITSSYPLFAITGCIAGLGAITDTLDGASARKHESTSEYGKILDQVTDKYFAGIVGINLSFINPMYICTLLGELLIASINTGYKLKYPNLDINSTRIGKIKTWPLYLTLALGFFSPINSTWLTISNISIAITFLAQLLTCASYVENNNREIKNLKIKETIEEVNQLIIEEDEKEKKLVLTKEKEQTLLEKYKDLSNLLKQIIEIKEKQSRDQVNDSSKTKKL